MAFPHHSPADPPYRCNDRKSLATIVSYRSKPGYTGVDTAVVEIFFPTGNAPTIRFQIDVR